MNAQNILLGAVVVTVGIYYYTSQALQKVFEKGWQDLGTPQNNPNNLVPDSKLGTPTNLADRPGTGVVNLYGSLVQKKVDTKIF